MVLGFSGKIGSGKSTISKLVAKDLGFGHAGFGDYVREIATQKNIQHTRRNLQDLGQQLLSQDIRKFCMAVLKKADWNDQNSVVVEGIRHHEIVVEIKRIIAPDIFKLIFLKLDDENVRRARNSSRNIEWDQVDNHVNESQVQDNTLTEVADFVLDAQEPLQSQKKKIIAWVHTQARFKDRS